MTDAPVKLSRRARGLRRTLSMFIVDGDQPIEKRRAALDRAGKLPKPKGCRFEPTEIGGVPAISVTPRGAVPGRHILYLHGGGYTMGSASSHANFAGRLGGAAHATATVLDYRLAPEHPYPAGIDDCVAAYRALIADHDPAEMVVAGDSAGGGATLATLLRLREAGDPLPACAYLVSPWTDLTASGASIESRADSDPMIKMDLLHRSADDYVGDTPKDDPFVSPLFADLSGLPPLLIQVGDDEVLLDDSTRLADRATEAGVDVRIEIADGLWHVYPALAGLMPEADAAVDRAAKFIWAHTG